MKIKIVLGIVLACSLLMLCGCNEKKDELGQVKDPLILKSYKTPERLTSEFDLLLNNLLFFGETKVGKASITPDGQLLVVASESIHDGIRDMIEQIKNNDTDPSPSVELSYWIVGGRKTTEPAKLDKFKLIKPALEAIQNKQGNMEFKLLDHVVATSLGGQSTRLTGAFVDIQHTVSAFSDRSFVADMMIRMNDKTGSITTTIKAKSGELVVLGQLSQEFIGKPIFEHAKDVKKHIELVNVYYILSADVKK